MIRTTISSSPSSLLRLPPRWRLNGKALSTASLSSTVLRGRVVTMSAVDTSTTNHGALVGSMVVKPPSHPTYDMKAVIKLALAEDAGDRGIALAEMIFSEVDPLIKSMADAAHPAFILETRKTAPGAYWWREEPQDGSL
ncbi:hypothetical protein J5N97_016486 [Dioscorea zingiberensis]|uniref:Uncharacterized protein n=1 Tax=Dioscorea zingiberensis TaxID=325984 RepID=A0A9D5HF81_9LILI|nr:hypothetical protein J5N97_016486 [Dioscorea zingiberensis]